MTFCRFSDNHYRPIGKFDEIVAIDRLEPQEPLREPEKVRVMAEAMLRGKPFLPIEVWVIRGNYQIHDGHHRVEASRMAGFSNVPVVRG